MRRIRMSNPSSCSTLCARSLRLARQHALAMFLLFAMMFTMSAQQAQAAPKPATINLIPKIQSLKVVSGQLLASGVATATVNGKSYETKFTAPVNISLAADQSAAPAAGCPILDLMLAPINLNLLGLVVQTSPICLTITAYQGGGLLGDLLCSVANLLNGGLTLNQILAGASLLDPVTGAVILPGLTGQQITDLLGGLANLFNGA